MRKKNWVVWNKETRSLEHMGTEEDMRTTARVLNENHQTDAHVAREYIPAEEYNGEFG